MSLDDSVLARLRALPGVLVECSIPDRGKYELPAELLKRTDILLCRVPPQNFDDLTTLKFMQLTSAGFEHIGHLHLADRPIRVCNALGVFETGIAEWNIAMMVNLVRDVPAMLRNQARAHWEKTDRAQREIRGLVLGLWGYGGIGRETARLAKACGMTVHVLSRRGVAPRRCVFHVPGTGDPDGVLPDRVFTAGEELDFLGDLDFLVLALPLNRTTRGLLGERELRTLPPTAFLLNPARGPIVQEEALVRALREGWIAGAALDTHYFYPLPPEHPLWTLPNVILTPHISGGDKSQHFRPRLGALFAQNVERFLAGQPLLNEVTKEEWRQT
jgi:phosphoglycerate dehydrogenase-like enzyme